MQAAVDTYQQALQAAPSTELFDRYIGFLTEQLQQHLQPADADDTNDATAAQQPAIEPAAAAAAARVLVAFEQAADAGGRCIPCSRCSPLLQQGLQLHRTATIGVVSGDGIDGQCMWTSLHDKPVCDTCLPLLSGLASEEALLDWPVLALRCGRPEAAVAAAQRAAAAMPQAPALQQQLLLLQAQRCTMQVPCLHGKSHVMNLTTLLHGMH